VRDDAWIPALLAALLLPCRQRGRQGGRVRSATPPVPRVLSLGEVHDPRVTNYVYIAPYGGVRFENARLFCAERACKKREKLYPTYADLGFTSRLYIHTEKVAKFGIPSRRSRHSALLLFTLVSSPQSHHTDATSKRTASPHRSVEGPCARSTSTRRESCQIRHRVSRHSAPSFTLSSLPPRPTTQTPHPNEPLPHTGPWRVRVLGLCGHTRTASHTMGLLTSCADTYGWPHHTDLTNASRACMASVCSVCAVARESVHGGRWFCAFV
jgi:hypothetical protein